MRHLGLRRHWRKALLLLLLGLCFLILGHYGRIVLRYLYDVAHGELPCFSEQSHHQHLRHMFFAFHDVMTRHNLTYWIDFGTLLGSVRRKGIIPYDHDGDIGYLLSDIEKVSDLVAPALSANYGIRVGHPGMPIQMIYQGVTVDLFVYATYAELGRKRPSGKTAKTLTRAFNRLSDFLEGTYHDKNMDDLLPIKLCPFEERWMMCPKNPEAVLRAIYPYTYRWGIRLPFKLQCYIYAHNLIRILFYGG